MISDKSSFIFLDDVLQHSWEKLYIFKSLTNKHILNRIIFFVTEYGDDVPSLLFLLFLPPFLPSSSASETKSYSAFKIFLRIKNVGEGVSFSGKVLHKVKIVFFFRSCSNFLIPLVIRNFFCSLSCQNVISASSEFGASTGVWLSWKLGGGLLKAFFAKDPAALCFRGSSLTHHQVAKVLRRSSAWSLLDQVLALISFLDWISAFFVCLFVFRRESNSRGLVF